MAILVKRGEVKAGGKYYVKGDIINGLSKQDEKWLISQGFAEEVDTEEVDTEGEIDIEKMTEKKLREFATLHGIDLSGIKGKANIIATISKSLQPQDGNPEGE